MVNEDQEQHELTAPAKDIQPSVNINVPAERKDQPLVSDEKLVDYYEEVMDNLRKDRSEASDRFEDFAEMALNDGDSSPSTKDTMVSLLKLRTETNDRMIKILDLLTRLKMKEKDTFPKYLAVQQNNKFEQKPNPKRLLDMAKKFEVETNDE